MWLEIPIVNSLIDQEFYITLDRVPVLLRFTWNFRSKRWVMDIKQSQGAVIVAGIAMVTNFPLTEAYKDTRLPPGDFVLIDNTGMNEEAGEESLSATHYLLYRSVL